MIPDEIHFLAKLRSTSHHNRVEKSVHNIVRRRVEAGGEFRCTKCVAIFRLISYILFKDLKTHLIIVALERHLYRPPRNNDDGGTLAKKSELLDCGP